MLAALQREPQRRMGDIKAKLLIQYEETDIIRIQAHRILRGCHGLTFERIDFAITSLLASQPVA